MYNNVNVYMLGVNPVRIKAANDSNFDLVEVSSQSTAPAGGNSGVSVSRTGSTSVALEVLYEVRLYDAYGARLEILPREVTIAAGQSVISLSTANLDLPVAASYAYAEFRIEADGNDYVVGENEKIILK